MCRSFIRLALLSVFSLPLLSLTSCSVGSGFGPTLMSAPQVINVSHYDPKERQRSGASYSPSDLSALKRNGALGLIARSGKGRITDTKCATFLKSAEREGMLIGSYYFILKGVDPLWQADRFVDRMRSIKASQGLRSPGVLMVVDFDAKSTPAEMVRVVDRVKSRTGTEPVVYLENSPAFMNRLNAASSSQKRRLKQCPYWLALYSNSLSERRTPAEVMAKYGVWNHCILWQYGGVEWEGGRSLAKHYNGGKFRSPRFFGNLDRPTERNAFNGTTEQLYSFWDHYSWKW
jgi:GH25 family lysozyme M1 (1,4-beta-N-acetylmuramidase)